MTENVKIKIEKESMTEVAKRAKFYANPDKTEYEELRTDKGIKIIQVKRYSNGVIKRRLKHIAKTDVEMKDVIERLKEKDKEVTKRLGSKDK